MAIDEQFVSPENSEVGIITGDESVPYNDWDEYLKAVEEGREAEPKDVVVRGRPDYEFNVDNALDNIDLTFNGYVPSKDAIEFFNIIRLVLGEDPEVDNGLMHYFLVDLVFQNIERKNYPYSQEINAKIRLNPRKIAVIATRMAAKSTILSAYLPIYCAITGKIPNFGKIMFMVGFGDSQQGGAKVQANTIRDFCSDSAFCKQYFEKMRFTDEECEFIRKGNGRIKDRAFMYKVKGAAGGSVRGIRYRTERPACHAVGTKIMTDHGVMNVEDYPYNYGEFEEYGKVVQVRGLVDKETVSSDHKYWAKKCDRKQVQDPELKTRVLVGNESEPAWTEAQTLTDRHWIGEPIDYEVVPVPELMYKETLITKRKLDGTVAGVGSKEVMKPHPMMNDPEFWWAYGLWLGDGVCYKKNDHTVVWTVADTQTQYTDRLRALFAKYDKSVCTVQMKGCHTVIASDAALARWLSGHKEGNSVKNIPDWVVKIDTAYQLEIVKGYIAADGFVDKRGNQIRINSVNLDALQKLQKMANRLGLPTYIRNTKQAGTQLWFNGVTSDHKHQYELRFSIGCAEILGFDEIVDSTKVMFKQVHIKDGWVWRQVKSVEDTEGKVKLVPITCFNAPMDGLPKHTYLTSFGLSKNCFIFDDIIKNESDAASPVIMKKLRSMIYADAENALGSKGMIIAVNTPFNKADPIYSALESGIWTPICLPICEKIDLDLKKKDFVGAWPAMHTYEKTMERYEDAYYGGTLREFNQELMLRISSEEDKMIKDDMIQWYDRQKIVRALGNFTVLITTDFTASGSKKGDFSGIAVWAIGADDDKFLIDIELQKRTIQEQYDALFRMVSRYGKNGRVVEVGMEIDGQQQLNMFALKQMMIEKNMWFRFAKQKGSTAEGIRSRMASGSKFERFKYMMPSFENKKMWFPESLRETADMKELLEELKYVTFAGIGSKHDDGLDLISQLGMIDYLLPSMSLDEIEDKLPSASSGIWGKMFGDDDGVGSNSQIF